jgi:hypothetical protein
VQIPPDAETQQVYTLIAGLATRRRVGTPAFSSRQEVVPVIGQVAIHGETQPGGAALDYRFLEGASPVIGLNSPDIRRTEAGVEVCLPWTSLQPTAENYHVFVHVVDTQGTLIHQVDSEPKAGRYPTSVWWAGERIIDCLALGDLPDGGWSLRVGLYALPSAQRLEVRDAQGDMVQDGAVNIKP